MLKKIAKKWFGSDVAHLGTPHLYNNVEQQGIEKVSVLQRALAGTMSEFYQILSQSPHYTPNLSKLEELIDVLYEKTPDEEDFIIMLDANELVQKMAADKPQYQIYVDDAKSISAMGAEFLSELNSEEAERPRYICQTARGLPFSYD